MAKTSSSKNGKDKNLEQILADIEKQFGKGSIMCLGENPHVKLDVVFKWMFNFRYCARSRWLS